jgi:hypothetical protein
MQLSDCDDFAFWIRYGNTLPMGGCNLASWNYHCTGEIVLDHDVML